MKMITAEEFINAGGKAMTKITNEKGAEQAMMLELSILLLSAAGTSIYGDPYLNLPVPLDKLSVTSALHEAGKELYANFSESTGTTNFGVVMIIMSHSESLAADVSNTLFSATADKEA